MGYFIAIEGPNGVGKGHQLSMLTDNLKSAGHTPVMVSNPGTTDLGQEIRSLLNDRSEVDSKVEAQALMFLAAKVQLWEEVISPALESDQIVICDRWHLSTLVHQGMLFGDRDIKSLVSRVLGSRRPDLNIVLIGEQETYIGEDSKFERNLEVGYMNYCYNCVEGLEGDVIHRYETSMKSAKTIADDITARVLSIVERDSRAV